MVGQGPAIGTDWLHFRAREHVDKSEGSGALLGLQLPPLTACGTLGNALYLSVPQFSPLQNEGNHSSCPQGSLQQSHEMMCVKNIAWRLAQESSGEMATTAVIYLYLSHSENCDPSLTELFSMLMYGEGIHNEETVYFPS